MVAPRLTVIVAVYNAARTLQACLDSIRAQDHPNVELLVMDGGSQDGSRSILEANSAHISYWESAPDGGIYHAWNKALSRATGDWIAFLGADDTFAYPQALSDLLHVARPESNLVFGVAAVRTPEGQVCRYLGEAWEWERLKARQKVAHSGALHHKSLFERFGRFDERYRICGDYDFLLRVGRDTRAAHLNRVVVNFSEGGVSTKQLRRALQERYSIQAAHPEIGAARAWRNYWLTTMALVAKTVLPSRWRPLSRPAGLTV